MMRRYSRREMIQTSGRLVVGAAAGAVFHPLLSGCSDTEMDLGHAATLRGQLEPADSAAIELTIVYDNVGFQKDLAADWGFACCIRGLDRTIIFDSGRYGDTFMANLSRLRIDPRNIDLVFLSHQHPDHIGGVMVLLDVHHDNEVVLVGAFSSGFKKKVRQAGCRLTEIDQPHLISPNCMSTGEMNSVIRNEHALLIPTEKGAIVLTGCAHPGIVPIVERAKLLMEQEILLVAGGFHLLRDTDASIRAIASQLNSLGVRYVAPSHCTGGMALKIFAAEFGHRFIRSGVGRTIRAKDLA